MATSAPDLDLIHLRRDWTLDTGYRSYCGLYQLRIRDVMRSPAQWAGHQTCPYCAPVPLCEPCRTTYEKSRI